MLSGVRDNTVDACYDGVGGVYRVSGSIVERFEKCKMCLQRKYGESWFCLRSLFKPFFLE